MNGLATLLSRPRLVFTAAALLAGMGILAWTGMDRQEDPRMPDYWGQVTASFPGADTETVERLLLEPIEDELAAVPEVRLLESTALPELALVEVELAETTADIDEAWDEVREALDRAAPRFPAEAGRPVLSDDQQDQESVVIAIVGSPLDGELVAGMDLLEDRLLRIPLVERVTRIADPGEQVTVAIDDAEARRLGLSTAEIARQLAGRARIVPGGSIQVGGQRLALEPISDVRSVDDLRASELRLPEGGMVPLGAVAEVKLGPEEPRRATMRHDGIRAVGLGVVPRPGINVVRFGEEVRRVVDSAAPDLAPLEARILTFQPERVEARLGELNRSLLLGILVVAGVLFLAMGFRVGLVVASVVPLVVLSSLAVYALAGGVLHQISVAALVIALGMLVDNAIVMTESVQWRLDRGESPREAARGSLRELLAPLAAATATTLAVFVPMALAKSTTADFTRAIPVVIMITLTLSYLFAVWFTPALAALVLRPGAGEGTDPMGRLSPRLADLAIRRPLAVCAAALGLVGLSLLAAGGVRQEFFPESDRNQLVVELELPEGSHLEATDALAARVEDELLGREDVTGVHSFVGRSAPHFYYNLSQIPWSPHLAQIVVDTVSVAAVEDVRAWLRDWSRREMPEADIVARKLEQGPPVLAPVELRLYGEDLEELRTAAERTVGLVRGLPGAVDVRHTLGTGAPVLRVPIEDDRAARQGVDRAAVASSLYGRTRGTPVGELRGRDEPIPIVLRSRAGEDLPVDALPGLDVSAAGAGPVPLAEVAAARLEWQPGAIDHRQRRRVVRVLAQLAPGATFSDVEAALIPRLEDLELPPGIEIERGGAGESSTEANEAMLRAVPLGALLLIAVLMAEFNSFRKVGLVLLTVPLAAAGVVPGLLLGDQPFGFMSLLGLIALVGVVVNNAIVLLDVVDGEVAGGADLESAIRAAIERRTRPILLTTATTVAGLLPLALSPTTLWPPLAWAMISGLVASTLLTLVVVPAACLLLFRSGGPRWRPFARRAAEAAGLLAAVLVLSGASAARAQIAEEAAPDLVSMTLEEAMAAAAERPRVAAAERRSRAAHERTDALGRSTIRPSLEVSAGIGEQDRDLLLSTPVGEFRFGSARQEAATVGLEQPLFDPARLHRLPAARRTAEAATRERDWARRVAIARAADGFLATLALEERLAVQGTYVEALAARVDEAGARVEAGRALEAERLRIRLELQRAEQEILRLTEELEAARARLGTAVGIAGAVDPIPPGGPVAWPETPVSELTSRAIVQRPDLAALAEAVEAERLEARAISAEILPRLDARVAYRWDTSTPFADDSWLEGGVWLAWRPLAAGTRGPRRRAAEAEADARAFELTEARRAVRDEILGALAALETAEAAERVARSGIEMAGETSRVERERFRAGRATASDLLEAESELHRQEVDLALAGIAARRAWIALRLASGDALLPIRSSDDQSRESASPSQTPSTPVTGLPKP